MGWTSPTEPKGQECDLVLVAKEWTPPWRCVDMGHGASGGEKK